MKKQIHRFLAASAALLCLLTLFASFAFAFDPIGLEEDVSLTVCFRYGDVKLTNAEFSLYRVADTDEWANFTPCGLFAGFRSKLNGLQTSGEWDAAAKELVEYIKREGISPLAKKRTGSDGKVVFGTDMKPGLYLVTCADVDVGKYVYSGVPALVSLPGRGTGSDALLYDVEMLVKPGRSEKKVPSPPPYLPQTGQLWWPVPVMLVLGLMFVSAGVVLRRNGRRANNGEF